LTAAGLAALVVFIAWERRSTSPLLDVGVFASNRTYAFSNLAALINYCGSAATGFFLSLYLQQIRGLPPQSAGLVLVAQPIVQAFLSPLTGRLSDSIEPRRLASLGMACTAAGLFLFSSLSPSTPFAVVVLILMLSGAGFALFSSPNTNAIMSSVERRFYGVAGATTSTMRVVGQTLSMGLAVLIFAVVIGRVEITPQQYPQLMTSIRIGFALFGALCLCGIFASLARGNVRRP
jgi:MFS family permease